MLPLFQDLRGKKQTRYFFGLDGKGTKADCKFIFQHIKKHFE